MERGTRAGFAHFVLAAGSKVNTLTAHSEPPPLRGLIIIHHQPPTLRRVVVNCHCMYQQDPVMDKAITGLSELTPNNLDEPRPVSPITLEVRSVVRLKSQ